MNDLKLSSPKDIKEFLLGTSKVEFAVAKKDIYSWLARFIKRVNYFTAL